MALDASGNLFVTDLTRCTIRRVDAITKTVNRIAGTGARGGSVFSGAYPATSSPLLTPNQLAFDGGGNLIVATLGIISSAVSPRRG